MNFVEAIAEGAQWNVNGNSVFCVLNIKILLDVLAKRSSVSWSGNVSLSIDLIEL